MDERSSQTSSEMFLRAVQYRTLQLVKVQRTNTYGVLCHKWDNRSHPRKLRDYCRRNGGKFVSVKRFRLGEFEDTASLGHDDSAHELTAAMDKWRRPPQDQASQHSSTGWGGVTLQALPITEELWTCDGFWDRVSLRMWPLLGWPCWWIVPEPGSLGYKNKHYTIRRRQGGKERVWKKLGRGMGQLWWNHLVICMYQILKEIIKILYIKNKYFRDGKMAQQVRAPTALPNVLILILATTW